MKDHLLVLKHVLDQERTEKTVLLIKHQPFQQEEKNKTKQKPHNPLPIVSSYSKAG